MCVRPDEKKINVSYRFVCEWMNIEWRRELIKFTLSGQITFLSYFRAVFVQVNIYGLQKYDWSLTYDILYDIFRIVKMVRWKEIKFFFFLSLHFTSFARCNAIQRYAIYRIAHIVLRQFSFLDPYVDNRNRSRSYWESQSEILWL